MFLILFKNLKNLLLLFFRRIYIYINLFIWLHWVFVAARRLSLVGDERRLLFFFFFFQATLHCGARASHCGDFSCCRARALGAQASVVVARGLSRCGSRALERRLSSCGTWAQLLRGMWECSRTRARTCVPCIGRWILNHCATREVLNVLF